MTEAQKVEPPAHSRLAPSSAYQYLRCSGAPNALAAYEDKTSFPAAEGTFFHEIAELVVEFGLEPRDFIGTKGAVEGFKFEFTREWARHMEPGVLLIREWSEGCDLYIEKKLDLSHWLGDGEFGTADIIIIDRKNRRIIIFDWKYGYEGVLPDWNYQLLIYCLGAWNAYGLKAFKNPKNVEVVLHIEQPRVSPEEGGGSWTTSMEEVIKFGEAVVRPGAEKTRDPNAPRTAGPKQCQYCAHAMKCDEYHQYNLSVFGLEFDDLDAEPLTEPPSVPGMTPERRTFMLKSAPMFRKYLEKLHEDAYNDAEKGRATPGMKLIFSKRPARKYLNEDAEKEAEEILVALEGQDAYISKLRSPAQAEDLIGKAAYNRCLAKFVDTGEPGKVLVDADHPKPACPTVVDDFEDLDA